jgi:hypothetical protein
MGQFPILNALPEIAEVVEAADAFLDAEARHGAIRLHNALAVLEARLESP